MAKVHKNVMVRGLKGKFGEQMVLKTDKAGRTIVCNKPVFAEDRVFTPAQQAQQERFRAARAYAKQAKGLEIYQAKAAGTPQTPSNVAMTDWFHRPEIVEIDLSSWMGQRGQVIRVRAVDDVMVKKVEVVILDETGEIREKGEGVREEGDRETGVRGEGDWWAYCTTTPATKGSKVLVRAEDLPGHAVERVKDVS